MIDPRHKAHHTWLSQRFDNARTDMIDAGNESFPHDPHGFMYMTVWLEPLMKDEEPPIEVEGLGVVKVTQKFLIAFARVRELLSILEQFEDEFEDELQLERHEKVAKGCFDSSPTDDLEEAISRPTQNPDLAELGEAIIESAPEPPEDLWPKIQAQVKENKRKRVPVPTLAESPPTKPKGESQ